MKLSKETHLPQLASKYECTACLACVNKCVHNALSSYMGNDGHAYIKIDDNKCVRCLACEDVCKKSRSCYGNNNLSDTTIYGAWSLNKEYRMNATSGGGFASMAETIIDKGGAVIGANLSGFECKHIAIYDKKDISKLQGSKYLSSSMEDVYDLIGTNLHKGDVLFAGLGCQCAGVLAFFANINVPHTLYTIDLVCGGVPSRILIDKFREEYPEATGIKSFRNKDKYELSILSNRGTEKVCEKTLLLHGFNCGMTNRYNCYECQYAKAHRLTDITIGDLWDYSALPNEHKNGVSMILVHSDKGKTLINNSGIHIQKIDWYGTLVHNRRIICGHQNLYFTRRKLSHFAKKMSNSRFKKLYTMTMRPYDLDLFIFRLYRYVRERLLRIKNKKMISNAVKRQKGTNENR